MFRSFEIAVAGCLADAGIAKMCQGGRFLFLKLVALPNILGAIRSQVHR
ncbi:hypothetical protein H6G20_23595 [Desertifilum sp. FACHB-1129]|uniref:Uncharacterized protein n=1 Tax=Desertifilum tharense IPPAS B-1220 TaxID=1781255 RepID=A0ACD5GQT2_9CYAN|nr:MULTISPECIES: hypothetical protein [Desertifilum]MBD2314657.1 hypothetical protein [Desertifilum sp. FACHB-1129]MBD2320283.1 hypothetical protein [Desertifilum sp. FACHB-866]MBD2330411.1 hypothetical protein [Desertifilum sp. FACHB-868]MDA0211322.1 hypothetical protein [Cyanobacteria bacterium FC1]